MARAPHTRAPDGRRDDREDAPAPAAPVAPGATGAARILWLQGAAGNHAVASRLARRPAPAAAGAAGAAAAKAPAAAPPVAGATRVVAGPPPLQVADAGEGPHPSADLAAGAQTVTLTFLIRDLHLKGRDPATIDWLHEPGVEIEATPGRVPKQVLDAAISALNVHVRVHGKDVAEVALGAKVAVGPDGTPSASTELKAQVQVTSTFSITAGTSISAAPRKDGERDEGGGVPLTPEHSRLDLQWSPLSIGVQFKLEQADDPARPGGFDYGPDMEDGKVGAWVAGQLGSGELGQLDPHTVVDELLGAMRAGGSAASWTMHLGVLKDEEIPAGLTRTLARAAQLIVQAKPSLRTLQSVNVTLLRLDATQQRETVVRRFALPLGSVTVAPAAPAPAPRTWGAPG
jgi:hypothetical protein